MKMLVELGEDSCNFLTDALSNAKTKQMPDGKWKSIALTLIIAYGTEYRFLWTKLRKNGSI